MKKLKQMTSNFNFTPISAFQRGLKPDPVLTVSQWADLYRELPPGSAQPGKFRMSVTPYNREICDRLTVNDHCQKVVYKKASQVGATETGNNWLGYIIDNAPAPMLYVMPTDTMVKGTSKKRIQPMLNSTPSLKGKVRPSKSRDGNNTIMEKMFEGGSVTMVGANSPVGLASIAVRYVYLDEVDRYPLDVAGEGSAIDLAETRTITFGARKKLFITSTPTRKGMSAIDNAFEKTGQRFYFVPCPFCGAAQNLVFEQLRWEKGKYSNVQYECVHCHQMIPEVFKTKMFADGEWVARYPEREDGITYGYHINALYSPYGMYSWGQMAKDNDDAEGDIPKTITFRNTKLGETYEEEGEMPQWERLYAQREKFSQNTVFANVGLITCGVDVQSDRLELEIVGWMRGKESQSISFRVIMGDTTKEETWALLDGILNERFVRADGTLMMIAAMAVDTGYNTQYVYNFCARHAGTGRVFPIKGKDDLNTLFRPPAAVQVNRAGQKLNTIKVFNIGVGMIKSELYGWLKLMPKDDGNYPPGYCHFPEYDQPYFRGITAERLERSTDKKGFTQYKWVKLYKRNEALDCRVYARAAAAIMSLDHFTDDHWQKLILNAGIKPEKPKTPPKKREKDDFWK